MFWDPQCGPCAREIGGILSGEILPGTRVTFRLFPLNIHPDAREMAVSFCRIRDNTQFRAALSAWSGGQVFTAGEARRLVSRFRGLALPSEAQEELRRDLALGNEAGVSHTPTIITRRDGVCYVR